MKRKGAVRFTRKILNAPTSPFQLSRFSAPFPTPFLRPAYPIFDTFGPVVFNFCFVRPRRAQHPPTLPLNRKIPQNRLRNEQHIRERNIKYFRFSRLSTAGSILLRYPSFSNTTIFNFHKSQHAYSITVLCAISVIDMCD